MKKETDKHKEEKHKVDEINKSIESAFSIVRTTDAKKNEFLSNVSHGIRTPLNSIVGFSQMIAGDEENLEPESNEYLYIITLNSNLLL